jgi:hypothetical protein
MVWCFKKIRIVLCVSFFLAWFLLGYTGIVHGMEQRVQLAQASWLPEVKKVVPKLVLTNTVLAERTRGSQLSWVQLNELQPKRLFLRTTVTDTSGCSHVLVGGDVRVKVYRRMAYDCLDGCLSASLTSGSCSVVTSTDAIACSNNTTNVDIECQVDLPYFAEATDLSGRTDDVWMAEIEAVNDKGLSAQQQVFFGVNSLKAISVDKNIFFSTGTLGSVSGLASIEIHNSGNIPLTSIEISGTPMKCKVGTIPASAYRFSLSPDTPFELMTPLPDDGPALLFVSMEKSTAARTSSKKIFWRLGLPKRGLAGNCRGKISYVAR